jgi:hypothetical protein
MPADRPAAFDRVVVAGTRVEGRPLRAIDLAGGRDTLLVMPDEDGGEIDWAALGRRIEFARVDVPSHESAYRYRLVASIVLAEAARQVGRPAVVARRARRGLTYESALDVVASGAGELVWPEQLRAY